MSDMDGLIMNASLVDAETDEICGLVVGYERNGHRMRIKVLLDREDEFEDDDDPEKEDIPEAEPHSVVKAHGNVTKLRTGTEDG